MQDSLFHFINPLDDRLGRPYFSALPSDPGVYRLYDDDGSLIYVGKAKNLKLRLQSYRRVKIGCSSKLLRLVHTVGRIEYEICDSEVKALLRENELLRTEKPRFNVVNTTPEKHFYFKVRVLSEIPNDDDSIQVELNLTLNPKLEEHGEASLFGAFRGMALCQRTFFTLRRMLWLVSQPTETFEGEFLYPVHLLKKQRVHPTVLTVNRFWLNELSGFLHGFRPGNLGHVPLVHSLTKYIDHLPTNDLFYQNWFQHELECLQKFYRASSRNLHLKQHAREDSPIIAQAVLDDLISTIPER